MPGKSDECRGGGAKSCDATTAAETTTTEPETTTTTTDPETTTTTTEPETTTTTTQPETTTTTTEPETTTTTTEPETTTTTTQPETTTTTTEPETTTTTTEPETTTTTTEPETTTTTTEPETTTTTTEPETTTTTTEPETTTTTTQPETTTTTTESETTTTTTEPETTTTTTEPETTTTTTEPETTTTTTEPETTTTTTEPETTTTTEAVSATLGSIYAQGCHDPPSLASGGGKFINSTTFRYWCFQAYSLQGFNYIYCINNKWVGPMPQCVPTYANPNVDTIIKVNREISQAEPLPDWFLLAMLGFFGVVALSCLIAMLMCCLHLIGCYSGPVFSFGARHVYPRGPLCKCQDYCCCCCRCCKFCKMCCVGDEGDEDEDEEQKIAMVENENTNQYPEPGTMINQDDKGQEGPKKVKKKEPTSNVKVRNKPIARIRQV
ncbi:location of vulva defective 1-like [Argopecten irradians]|uniref:location of vulva defective 1-like n=1 Tax=Argopecten irradians TaxID=31199 RepID=UPI00371AAF93